ncbi:MAG: ATP-binding protein [Anaerotignum sp.]|nr:ATP-binding protein [Anaerotignum sp.]
MRTTKIQIKNLYGINEKQLDGKSVELTGKNGSGKTSVLDAIIYALTNSSNRDYIIKDGAEEGEILIETDTGLSISRKKRVAQADYKSIKDNGYTVQKPESFLQEIFTPLQLNPVGFVNMKKEEQNRIILDLIEFDWDLNWIREKFGEIPEGVDYQQNILQVLNDIQAEKGVYFTRRQDTNRDIKSKKAVVEAIAKDLPENYNAAKWESFDLSAGYSELSKMKEKNSIIQRAKAFKDSYDNKIRGYEAEMEIEISNAERVIAQEKEALTGTIERLKAELSAAEDKLKTVDEKLVDKRKLAEQSFETKKAKLGEDMQTAEKHANAQELPTAEKEQELQTAAEMIKHLNEYNRMHKMQEEIKTLNKKSEALTDKIELARMLPGEILKTATIPVTGLTVENGIPLINGLPVSNLSEGEKLSLCVDVAISRPNALQIILIDGAEKLSEANRTSLYSKCKEKGLQFIATRTTDDDCLEVTEL